MDGLFGDVKNSAIYEVVNFQNGVHPLYIN